MAKNLLAEAACWVDRYACCLCVSKADSSLLADCAGTPSSWLGSGRRRVHGPGCVCCR